MKISIEEQLRKESGQRREEIAGDKALQEVKLLMSGDELEDMRILRQLGVNSNIQRLDNEHAKMIELENLDKQYGEVFTIEEIKNLAIKYRLRLLNSKHFIGDLDVQIAAKVKQFAKDTNSQIDNFSLGVKFFILAPPEMFSLEQVDFVKTKDRYPDPLLFYKIDEEHYRLIHKWGNDFSIFRRYTGWKWENLGNWWFNHFCKMLPIVTFIFYISAGPSFVIDHWIWTMVMITGGSIIASTIMNGAVTDDNWFDQEDGFFTPHNWRNTHRLK